MNIEVINKRLKPIFEKVCGDRYDITKCLWQIGLTDDFVVRSIKRR